MKDEVRLQDPVSGAEVRIGRAELHQRCPECGEQMLGMWAASTEATGWKCLRHLWETLALHNASDRGVCAQAARTALSGAAPGDKVTVTRQLLVAVGIGRANKETA